MRRGEEDVWKCVESSNVKGYEVEGESVKCTLADKDEI